MVRNRLRAIEKNARWLLRPVAGRLLSATLGESIWAGWAASASELLGRAPGSAATHRRCHLMSACETDTASIILRRPAPLTPLTPRLPRWSDTEVPPQNKADIISARWKCDGCRLSRRGKISGLHSHSPRPPGLRTCLGLISSCGTLLRSPQTKWWAARSCDDRHRRRWPATAQDSSACG